MASFPLSLLSLQTSRPVALHAVQIPYATFIFAVPYANFIFSPVRHFYFSVPYATFFSHARFFQSLFSEATQTDRQTENGSVYSKGTNTGMG